MSTEYIHFTTEQREAARQTDLVALLQSQGEHLKRSGKEYVWRDGSEKVTVRGNLWFHQYERIGGDAVDFVRRFYNMGFNIQATAGTAEFLKQNGLPTKISANMLVDVLNLLFHKEDLELF